MNRIDLNGRVAIVTGGASGLGLAAAERLIASGAMVELWDTEEGKLSASVATLDQGQATTRVVDVTNLEAVERAAADVFERNGKIDILVNSAGIAGPVKQCVDYPIDAWHRVLAVNLTGVFHCCRAIVPFMKAGSYGRIINVSSMAGKEGNPDQIAYVASKAGVIGLTKGLAKEVALTGVIVNAVAPGVFGTPFANAVFEENPEYVEGLLRKIPLNRMGRLDEFGALVAWLASQECSFSTGFTYDLSGGRASY